MDRPRSKAAFARAQRVLVGGVNSPVRAFRAVGGDPVFVARTEGAYVHDLDGARYVDLVGTWGPAIVGHAHPEVIEAVTRAAQNGLSFGACCEAEAALAELILSALPGHDKVRFVNSGTEAAMSAVRLVRAATGRAKLVKFEGCYHGHLDALLVAAGSGAATLGVPDSAGVTAAMTSQTLLARYNDLEGVARLFAEQGREIAALLVEPVAGNMGFVRPEPGFLEGLRRLCDEHGALLVFDEVMTGFRVAWGGYQRVADVQPDVTILGKVIGGGMPVAAYTARAELMDQVSPLGPVYQAGTLSGNPIGMAAGIATLELCRAPGFYDALHARSTALADGLIAAGRDAGVPLSAGALGGMAGFFFRATLPRDYAEAQASDHARFARFFRAMLDRGVWLPPSSYEAIFISNAHTEDDVQAILEAARGALAEVNR
ncbi:MAG: glutamate-1-semialdehyde 2,1-aminomutase [Planctomycetota bacterium]